jgi:hypothetical protein
MTCDRRDEELMRRSALGSHEERFNDTITSVQTVVRPQRKLRQERNNLRN